MKLNSFDQLSSIKIKEDDLVSKAMDLERQCDLISDKIQMLNNEKIKIKNEISALKKRIELQYSNLIGKKAICTTEGSPKPIICTCNLVKCWDDFSVHPLFSIANKKVSVATYEWIN